MFLLSAYLYGLLAMVSAAVFVWLLSLLKRNVAIVDILWSLFFVIGVLVYAVASPATGPRLNLLLVLVSLWAVRLAGHISWRSWGEEEDRRYQAIRANNEPNFAFKSLYLVFVLQALIAWFVSLPLLAGVLAPTPIGPLDILGAMLCVVGIGFEAVGDFQLARFKAKPVNADRVMDRGLWRFTRHPNYFGDFCVWWGFYLIAVSAGGWWSLPGPLLMSLLLLKVSGVALLEKDIATRRPEYARYVASTNAFFPGLPRATVAYQESVK